MTNSHMTGLAVSHHCLRTASMMLWLLWSYGVLHEIEYGWK